MDHQEDTSSLTLEGLQKTVDAWITGVGNGYFSPLTNMAVLAEECGEVTRVMARQYGDQRPKPGDNLDLADELCDLIWTAVAIANQCGVDLPAAFAANLAKKSRRDASRFAPENTETQSTTLK